MVALRRFFHAEKTPSTPASGDRESQTQSPLSHASNAASPELSENEHFQNIERQFEVLHDELKARPSHIPLARASSRLTPRNPRHVDLLDALFSGHRYQKQSPGVTPRATTASPITPYNEDVAERNMVPFLRPRNGRKRNAYSRIISALYQEDVADRNISQNRRRSRSLSRSTSRPRLTTSRSQQMDFQCQGDETRGRSRSISNETQLVNSISQEALYSVPKSFRDQVVADGNESSAAALRTQRSAPTVMSEQENLSEERVSPHLGVPPAHKQGGSWTNTPLPDSPTLPTATYVKRSSNDKKTRNSPATTTSSPRLPSTPKDVRPPMARRKSSKKNILDLSINTELAARGRPKKITHRAIQPPTPSTLDGKKNPSIAEIMNSPAPLATPTQSPLPSSNKKVAEIMDMFRKAYTSTQAFTPHPTFETLQDAIIREINSHEAFQRVPVPDQGPPFTPSPSEESFDQSATPPKPIALKDGQRRRRMSSFSKKHQRESDTHKSISTSVPLNTALGDSGAPSRRRHTDAPPPSPGFFDTLIPQHPSHPDNSVTYMDLLLRSENSGVAKRKRTSSVNTGRSPHSATPSVLYMRAQTGPSNEGNVGFADDDGDSDIIHLPSISGIPQVQIQGVDENNVTYTAENTTPRNAYRLMSWPRKTNPFI
ncbi:hypothetical protein ASPVEDRAFT_50681 [Aspergillus versicolor CBS 583.65]|uniref:Uncharacterized protein n=1 Tax=Aspergillus versicolor CBS 583.65 TaxID=1036611 RepID=A0A1L9PCA9_ASPVE|nr:uncharacterized protein ASPVEDRAFT_50681 [Aspergillus versicolor CBS 583.65]OJI99141.1 hypothetical protein ASPVEDRAFT_50681 [Aspergillus versicolor CBS 583.65]